MGFFGFEIPEWLGGPKKNIQPPTHAAVPEAAPQAHVAAPEAVKQADAAVKGNAPSTDSQTGGGNRRRRRGSSRKAKKSVGHSRVVGKHRRHNKKKHTRRHRK